MGILWCIWIMPLPPRHHKRLWMQLWTITVGTTLISTGGTYPLTRGNGYLRTGKAENTKAL